MIKYMLFYLFLGDIWFDSSSFFCFEMIDQHI